MLERVGVVEKHDIGLVGLAVMGENLVLNMESKGFSVAVFNRTQQRMLDFINGRAKGKNIAGYTDLEGFIKSILRPRKIMLMVKAGAAVDALIDMITPYLDSGDIVIDGGNTHYPDTVRRTKHLEGMGFFFVGAGVSGGEEGALLGPSIMPGGSAEAWLQVRAIFQKIAANVGGEPCCEWVGPDGSGHFVKMVHNGIEYGDMQLICEAYHIMQNLAIPQMHEVFSNWNKGVLNSYLVEVTAEILAYRENGEMLVEKILDVAGQKGTGKWASVAALDFGVALTLISEAVFARCISALKDERVAAAVLLKAPELKPPSDIMAFLGDIESALYASKIVSYAQGYSLLKEASLNYGWDLNLGKIASMWRGGCIIRSAFLGDIRASYEADTGLANLMLAPFFREALEKAQPGWRRVCAFAVENGIPIPAFSSALAYFDAYRSDRLPANLLQAQRDYFGAHTYERTDHPRGKFFHTNWTGRGGYTASTTYNA